jgi:hypothetical protein
MAAAALEANANEIIQDIVDGISPLPLTEGSRLLLKDLKDDRSGNSRDKYRRLALICDKLPNMGSVAWHDADLLIRLRNSLMHFKPAWDYEDDVHESKLIKSLREKVPTYRAYTDCFIFPYGLLTYGCARWSVESVLIFAGMFSAMVGVQNKFVAAHLDFSLPSVRSV